ncbi:MAG TPA: ABC transporter permease subunit [Thermoanaerobaculia bacterium]
MTRSPLFLCAAQELTVAIRSRWTQTFAIVFTILALAVCWSGYVFSGGSGAQDFARTAASLVELVVLLIPLAALILGLQALTPESGGVELLYSQPASRRSILLGQLLGVFVGLGAAQLVGFGAAGIVIFANAGSEGIGVFLMLVAGSLLLTAAFLAIAAAVATGSPRRGRARKLAVALVIWFGATMLFDVAALGIASFLPSGRASRLLIAAVIVNPVDAVRTGAAFAAEGTAAFGAASLAFLRFTRGAANGAALLAASLVLWIVAPAAFAARRLDRTDL